MEITTKYSAHKVSGRGRIVVKCGGKQLTVGYDHALSASQNHATAAAMLASKLHLSGFCCGALEGLRRAVRSGSRLSLGYVFDNNRECMCSKYFVSDRRTARLPAQ